jgi:hypothetical protein
MMPLLALAINFFTLALLVAVAERSCLVPCFGVISMNDLSVPKIKSFSLLADCLLRNKKGPDNAMGEVVTLALCCPTSDRELPKPDEGKDMCWAPRLLQCSSESFNVGLKERFRFWACLEDEK